MAEKDPKKVLEALTANAKYGAPYTIGGVPLSRIMGGPPKFPRVVPKVIRFPAEKFDCLEAGQAKEYSFVADVPERILGVEFLTPAQDPSALWITRVRVGSSEELISEIPVEALRSMVEIHSGGRYFSRLELSTLQTGHVFRVFVKNKLNGALPFAMQWHTIIHEQL